MPAWWRAKSKPKTNSSPSAPRKKLPSSPSPPPPPSLPHCSDESSPMRRREPSPVGGPIAPFSHGHGHPLPLPFPSDHLSASISSVSSSGSSDETPSDFGFARFPEGTNIPRDRNMKLPPLHKAQHTMEERSMIMRSNPVMEHARRSEISISSRRDFQVHGFDVSSGTTSSFCRTQMESMFELKTQCSSACSRGHLLSTSPTRKQDDLRSPPHPLPLPPSSPDSASSSRSPQSQWKKGKMLGRGTFGHVYQGFNSESGQMCAIKEVTLISDDSNSRESLKQLNQEISLLSHLSHPNIVQYYGSKLVDDTLSVYLEYVSGGSIHKLLKEYGPFGEPVIRSYTAQLLSGLVYLHARNTVHRDIKGANILVDPNGEIKLADFGMAKHISSYNSIRSFKGSPYWMAPEVIMNGSGYNLSVDIWSLGCTVLEMATSKPPWSQFEGVAAIFKIGNSKDIPEIPDHLSPDGKNFLKLCLQRDPSARSTAAQLVDHPFVRDQATSKVPKFNSFRDTLSSTSEGNKTTIRESPFNRRSVSPLRERDQGVMLSSFNRRSVSPLRERDQGVMLSVGQPSVNKSPSDLVAMRMNMSLPVSPCTSPLRQFKQSNWSCLPSPPHPAFSTYGPGSYSVYSSRSRSNCQDPWLDIPQLKAQTSPKR